MPLPSTIARLNRVGLNRVTRRLAPHLPGFGVVVHRGRRSGKTFRTPVNVFPTPTGMRLALTYGADTDWVKNVRAADGCRLLTRGRTIELTDPRLVHDPARTDVGPIARRILPLLKVSDFLDLTDPARAPRH